MEKIVGIGASDLTHRNKLSSTVPVTHAVSRQIVRGTYPVEAVLGELLLAAMSG